MRGFEYTPEFIEGDQDSGIIDSIKRYIAAGRNVKIIQDLPNLDEENQRLLKNLQDAGAEVIFPQDN